MEHSEFIKLADECLERVTAWLESFDADEVDFSTADGVLKIEFADGTIYVLNRQAATDQMWFAAGVRAFHYDRSEGGWRDDRDGHLLEERISQALSDKLGRPVSLPAPGA
jgi:iron-sulfur cluster assembly protein CyaY